MLSAAGNIGFQDSQLLKAHLENCATCRATLENMVEIHARWLPERPGFEIHREHTADVRHRDAILKTLSKSGVHFSRTAKRAQRSSADSVLWPVRRGWLFLAAGIMMFCISAGLLVQARRHPPSVAPVQAVRVPPPGINVVSSGAGASQSELEAQISAAAMEQDRLRQELLTRERNTSLLEQSNAAAASTIAELRQQLEEARANQQRAEAQLGELRSKRDSADAIALLQQNEIQNLNSKMNEQAASFERERQTLLLGGREVRDLIAARNLHIIDVYDTDTKGRISRAFGRIFYQEGKSLVFYAYDLNKEQADNGKATYYVWGKRDDAPRAIKSLGALVKDDHTQERWVFTTTNTKILASIDSVFVTTEPTDVPGSKPKGKPLLTAFLGTAANHP